MLWHFKDRSWDLSERCRIFGILNVTPDSFYDGGQFDDLESALNQADRLVAEGADALDIGGESTRPGSEPVPAEEEVSRVVPVIRAVRKNHPAVVVSVDTCKAAVAEAALEAGAEIVNDITAGRDPRMAAVVAASGAGWILMHMQGTPKTMQVRPVYADVAAEIRGFFCDRLMDCAQTGIAPERIALDPGIGFGKTVEHNLEILARTAEFCALGRPVMVGASRKSFLSKVTGAPSLDDRLPGSLAAAAWCAAQGARLLRVHDVSQTRRAIKLIESLAPYRQ